MKKRTKISLVLSSAAAILLAGSVMAGGTYALFTSESKTNIAVTSGTVDVEATISVLKTYSGVNLTGNPETDTISETAEAGKFTNGGTATLSDNTLTLDKMTPGDKVTFTINIKNNSNVAVKYRTVITCEEDDGLLSGLEFTIGGNKFDGLTNKSNWTELAAEQEITGANATLDCSISLPSDAENEYQGKVCKVTYSVEAVQGNAATTDPDRNVIEIDNAAQLGLFRDKINKLTKEEKSTIYGNKTTTIKITENIDLNNQEWEPIDWNVIADRGIILVFDGNNKTISNFTVTGDTGEKDLGLFSYANFATFKNVNIINATVTGAGRIGALVGRAYATTFDTCSVTNSTIIASTWKNPKSVDTVKNPEGWDDGDKVGALAGQMTEGGNKITGCTVSNNTLQGYRDVGCLAGYFGGGSGGNSATGNTINGTNKIINDRTHNYQGYATDGDYSAYFVASEVGQAVSATVSNNNISSVTFSIKNS